MTKVTISQATTQLKGGSVFFQEKATNEVRLLGVRAYSAWASLNFAGKLKVVDETPSHRMWGWLPPVYTQEIDGVYVGFEVSREGWMTATFHLYTNDPVHMAMQDVTTPRAYSRLYRRVATYIEANTIDSSY